MGLAITSNSSGGLISLSQHKNDTTYVTRLKTVSAKCLCNHFGGGCKQVDFQGLSHRLVGLESL